MATATGLKLGLSRSEVEGILGTADFVAADRIGYLREFKRRTTKEEFQKLRAGDSNLTDKRAHELYDFIPDTMQAEIRFTAGRASYLCVSATQVTD
jgi:hypothetical protein